MSWNKETNNVIFVVLSTQPSNSTNKLDSAFTLCLGLCIVSRALITFQFTDRIDMKILNPIIPDGL